MTSIEWVDIVKLFFSLVFVLSLMALLAFVMRYLDAPNRFNRIIAQKFPRRRLQVIERHTIDRNNTVVILRCDSREHVVVIGQNAHSVLESRDCAAERKMMATPDLAEIPTDYEKVH